MSAHNHLTERYSVSQDNFNNPYCDFKQEIQFKSLASFSKYIEIPPKITDKK